MTLLKLKFAATNEAIDISKVAFQLAASGNTPVDLVGQTVKLYDSANPTVVIGSATWGSSAISATSTAIVTGTFRVPSGGYKTMLIKGDIAAISGSVGPLIASGDLLSCFL